VQKNSGMSEIAIFVLGYFILPHPVVSPYQILWQYSDWDPLTGAKIAIFGQYLALVSITGGPSRVVNISMAKYYFTCISFAID